MKRRKKYASKCRKNTSDYDSSSGNGIFYKGISLPVFPGRKEDPADGPVSGNVLPPAVIGMLVVYCLKDVHVTSYSYGIPEAISVVTVVLLHLWKRNNLLSIGVGTVLYMFLVQVVFAA